MREEQLSDRGAVQGNITADFQPNAQRPIALDPVEINHSVSVEHAEIAGLANFRHELLENDARLAPLIRLAERRRTQARQARTCQVTLTAQFSAHEPEIFQ